MPQPAVALPGFEPQSLVGTVLDGRYRITAHLATGGMGAVFRAEHVHMHSGLALKVLRPDLVTSPEIVERFRREAEIASTLRHQNIVRVTDFGRSSDGYLYLAMELLEGESLFDRLRREGTIPVRETVDLLAQVCAALEAAHRLGVVHRDLKPENIFLDRQRDGRRVAKILDFGIAKIGDPQSRSSTQSGMVVGTPEYLSPEQALGAAVDARADLYAVGLIGWRMLAGRHPFQSEDPRALLMMQATQPVPPLTDPRPDLAAYPGLVAVLARACAKSTSERHGSADALRRELESCLVGDEPAEVRPIGVPGPQAAATPVVQPSLERGLRLWSARLRATGRGAARAGPRLLRSVPGLVQDGMDLLRLHPRVAAALAGLVLAAAGAAATRRYLDTRPAAQARQLLALGKAAEALPLLERAVSRRPDDAQLRLLQGNAWHRTGSPAQAYGAWEAALVRDRAALDGEALAALASDLARDRATADRAALLLSRVGQPAVPAVLAAAGKGPGFARLRALALARDLGAEDRLDRVGAYVELLGDPDCEVRRAAARRLGELGAAQALPKLKEAARAHREVKSFWGTKSEPACGSSDAAAAVRRIAAMAGPNP